MASARETQNRVFLAVDLENKAIELGLVDRYLASDCSDPEIRATLIREVSKWRGKAVAPSPDTWDLLAVFLKDRFVR